MEKNQFKNFTTQNGCVNINKAYLLRLKQKNRMILSSNIKYVLIHFPL
jgi:hypothetical protein